MNIAIIGTGNMGTPLAKYFAQIDHRVFLGSRDKDKGKQIANEIGYGVQAKTVTEAVEAGDIIFLAVPHKVIDQVISTLGPLDDKIVVDMSNCFTSDFSGLTLGYDTSAAEEIAKQIPTAKIVKAFNTIFATILQKGLDFDGQKPSIFIASDDETAKQTISSLIESIGLLPVDCGELKSARYLEPLAALILQIDSRLKRAVQIVPSLLERSRPI